jgi:PHD/YefM family antitoxin component YafN of YafNO toxin-antitoxin module
MSSAAIVKKVVVNERGTPVEVILSWKTFRQIAETLGLDLDGQAKADLRETRRDLAKRNRKAFVPLASL